MILFHNMNNTVFWTQTKMICSSYNCVLILHWLLCAPTVKHLHLWPWVGNIAKFRNCNSFVSSISTIQYTVSYRSMVTPMQCMLMDVDRLPHMLKVPLCKSTGDRRPLRWTVAPLPKWQMDSGNSWALLLRWLVHNLWAKESITTKHQFPKSDRWFLTHSAIVSTGFSDEQSSYPAILALNLNKRSRIGTDGLILRTQHASLHRWDLFQHVLMHLALGR